MPRRAKGPRLYLDRGERVFVIRDGARKRRTGCGEGERERAEIALRDYIASKYQPISDHRPDRVLVADVLTYYSREIAPAQKSSATTGYAIDHLLGWWQARALSDVKRSTCAAYVDHRRQQPIPQAKTEAARKRLVSVETARRELTVLRAAINAYHAEHVLDAVPIVSLPPAAPPRERFLTRSEVAKMLRCVRRHPDKAARLALSRFILIGVYTGTRSGAIRDLGWLPSTTGGWVDLEAGVIHRRPVGARETNKRRPPLRTARRLAGHLRRWQAIDARAREKAKAGSGRRWAHVVHYAGTPVEKQRRAWDWMRRQAGLGADVVPHILRHTAVTWAMQRGADLWEAAGYFGMSPEVLWRVYGHHHPDWQSELADQIGRARR
jgi:integrase